MTVKTLIGDIFDSEAQTLVNTVNCVGVMGKGLALQFKKRFPNMYKDYADRCEQGVVKLGQPYLYKQVVTPWILNFPTKDHWRSAAHINSIIHGLEYLIEHYEEWGITSIAVPPLGCGEGQLEWRIVGPTLYEYLNRLAIPVELYAPYGTPHSELQTEFLNSKSGGQNDMPAPEQVKPGWVVLVEILRRIEEEPYRWPVGRIIFQKIAYVATEEGIPTGLNYQRGSYGPFSSELNQVKTRLVNNGLIWEERLGPMFAVRVGRTFDDARKAYHDTLAEWDAIIDKVVDLFQRMDSRQAEIVSTVLFAARELEHNAKQTPQERDVLNAVMQWKQKRKPPLSETDVAYTIRNLAMLHWLKVEASHDLPLPQELDFEL